MSLVLRHYLLYIFRTARGSQSAWAKFERGEVDLLTFYEEFGRELSDVVSGNTE